MVRYSIYLIPDYQRAFVVRNFRFLLQTPSNKPEFGSLTSCCAAEPPSIRCQKQIFVFFVKIFNTKANLTATGFVRNNLKRSAATFRFLFGP